MRSVPAEETDQPGLRSRRTNEITGGRRGRESPGLAGRVSTQGGGRRGGPESTLPASPPGTEGGSVRVNTAATAANTASPPHRPAELRGPARAARPGAGPLPSLWRPIGRWGPRTGDPGGEAASPRIPGSTALSFPQRGERRVRGGGDFRVGPPQAGPYLPLPERGGRQENAGPRKARPWECSHALGLTQL